MDAAGIALSIGSISIPGVWFGDAGFARRLAREWNDHAASIVSDHPGRFGFFATIAPPDVEGSLIEIEYALDVLRADGVALMSSYDGRWLGDDAFAPVMAELDRRQAVVFVHPGSMPEEHNPYRGSSRTYWRGRSIRRGRSSACSGNGVLARCPDIRFVFAHGGGTMPFLAGRLAALSDGTGQHAAGSHARGAEPPLFRYRARHQSSPRWRR